MINEKMQHLGKVRSAIRELFEYGIKRAAIVGAENVYDYSIGNPSTPPPAELNEAIKELVSGGNQVAVHGYTPAMGDKTVREILTNHINSRFGTEVKPEDMYITCGASAGLAIALNALYTPGDEVVTPAPFFPEYRVFAEHVGYKLVPVMSDLNNFQINLPAMEKAINERTKIVIINSPNNPTGVVLRKEVICRLTQLLRKKEAEYGHQIYLLADEPYRELVYDDIEVPYFINEYDDTIVCYSFSKSMSIPGDRIGYLLVNNKMPNHKEVFWAIAGAGRALGYVCPPSLLQKAVAKSIGSISDINTYKENRDILYNALTEYGFKCVYPDGAFYLFMEAPGGNAQEFSDKAKAHDLLIVPADSFGVEGYVRLSYCVSKDMILRSLPAFKELAKETLKNTQ